MTTQSTGPDARRDTPVRNEPQTPQLSDAEVLGFSRRLRSHFGEGLSPREYEAIERIHAEAASPAALNRHVGHALGVIPPAVLVCDTCEMEL